MKLDDILSCPVCYDNFKYGKKILQCRSGHAMCETCHEKLVVCPVCKDMLIGTRLVGKSISFVLKMKTLLFDYFRNFMMEEMIKKLRRLSTGALMSLDEEIPTTSVTVEQLADEPNEVSEVEEEDGDVKELQPKTVIDEKKELIKQKKKLKRKLKKIQQKRKELEAGTSTEIVSAVGLSQATPLSTTSLSSTDCATLSKKRQLTESSNGSCASLYAKKLKKLLKIRLNIQNPTQPKGVFPCPITGCEITVPFCRLLNHIRWNHKDILSEIECECSMKEMIAKVDVQIQVPVEDYRHIVHVREFGLFIIVFKAIREVLGEDCAINDVTAFVKMVGTVSMAKSFNYDIKVSIGKYVAQVSDMCHHTFTSEEELPVQEQCLNLKVSKLSKFAKIQVKFLKNTGTRTRKPIKQETIIIPNYGSANHQGESSHNLVTKPNNNKSKKKKNKSRKR